jgi:hypothetical protein
MEKIDVFNYKKYRDGAENDVNARVSHVNYVIQGFNDANDLGYYEIDMAGPLVVNVNTQRGIIEIYNVDTIAPSPAFGSSANFIINNPDLDLSLANRENIYVQYSVYYSQVANDNAIPYLISTGAVSGLQFTLYNANPALDLVNQWQGALYVYYELYTKN